MKTIFTIRNISFYQQIAILLVCLWALIGNLVVASEKKGVGLADLNVNDRLTTLNVAWYYTWEPQPIKGASAHKFVPMFWGGEHQRMENQMLVLLTQKKVPILLAINEPDRVKQANMSVEETIHLWPKISAMADQISTPATAEVLGGWFDRFYRMAIKLKLKMDFMAIHLYGPPDAEKFLKKVDAVYEKYGMPIWITEFAVADWKARNQPGRNRYSEETVLAFMKIVLPELEKRPYVIRYAWFSAGLKNESLRTSRLFDKYGKLTRLGKFYADFTWK
ncbi:glycosyl hydrolase [Methylobacter sp.]|uniref:glycosyl hydrolase n=1 Tax=Methylobacter sp. TaxID=2051955 RepID=UPI003DA37AF4